MCKIQWSEVPHRDESLHLTVFMSIHFPPYLDLLEMYPHDPFLMLSLVLSFRLYDWCWLWLELLSFSPFFQLGHHAYCPYTWTWQKTSALFTQNNSWSLRTTLVSLHNGNIIIFLTTVSGLLISNSQVTHCLRPVLQYQFSNCGSAWDWVGWASP